MAAEQDLTIITHVLLLPCSLVDWCDLVAFRSVETIGNPPSLYPSSSAILGSGHGENTEGFPGQHPRTVLPLCWSFSEHRTGNQTRRWSHHCTAPNHFSESWRYWQDKASRTTSSAKDRDTVQWPPNWTFCSLAMTRYSVHKIIKRIGDKGHVCWTPASVVLLCL